jgi:hypothetical protein
VGRVRHLARHGKAILLDEVTEEGSLELARRFYREIGGADFFDRLCTAFYQLVLDDPVLGPMFTARSADEHARRLKGHFERMYGTPDLTEGWNPAFPVLRLHVDHDQRKRRGDRCQSRRRHHAGPATGP